MKTWNSKLVLVLAMVSTLGVGCGSSTSSNSPNQAPVINTGDIPVSPDGVYDSNGNASASQQTAVFTPVSIQEMNSFVAMHPLNDPKDFLIMIDLEEVENGRYAGQVKLSYKDNGVTYYPTFETSSDKNQSLSGLKDNNKLEAEYNRWFTINGKYYFSAYFQDAYGSIVLVFDNYVNQGDAQGTGVVSGAVYYKNFAQSYATQSPYRTCWYIYNGPYDCRADAVSNKNAIYPTDNAYRKLGTFSGLSKAAVFNQ